MTQLILISIFLYIVWVLLYWQRKRIKKFFNSKTELPPIISPIEPVDDDIMGKTKPRIVELIEKPIAMAVSQENSRSALVDKSELDAVFSDTPEPMDLDVEFEYNEEELLEEEELICLLDNETIELATGIHYDDMENLIQVMQQSRTSQEAELNAVNTIHEMDQTDLFQLMVSQIEGGKERVTEMLNKYKTDSVEKNSTNVESRNAGFQQFEINEFL
ncbi:MAG: hypothetical protein GZ091_02805 [Paludibacter sp.]|nr:hypothetical protein [Paludibacter sp.]